MPREFDHGAPRDGGRGYPVIGGGVPAPRMGSGEVSVLSLWPTPLDAMHGPRHQYRLADGSEALADRMHDWLSRHARGRWSWVEIERDGGRRVETLVYVEREADRAAFEASWDGAVEVRPWAAAHNSGLAAPYAGPRPAMASSSSGVGAGVSRSLGSA